MKLTLIFVLLFLLPLGSIAQFGHPDSLLKDLRSASSDSMRFLIMKDLAIYYTEVNPDSAIEYCDKIILVARENNKILDEAFILNIKGYALYNQGKYAESYASLLQALQMAENIENENKTWFQNSYPFFLTSSNSGKARLVILENIHQDIGITIGLTGNIEQIIYHYNEARKIAEEIGDTSVLGIIYMNLGVFYYTYLNKVDSALLMEKNAMRIFEATGVKEYVWGVYMNLGDIYLREGEIDSALHCYHKGINSAIEQNNPRGLVWNYKGLTDLFLLQKDRDSSLYYAKKFLQKLYESDLANLGTAYQNLYESYKLNDQVDSAFKYQGLALTYKDSAYSKTIENLAGFQKLYLEEQIRVQKLKEEKALSDARTRNYALLAGLGVLLLIGLMIYRNFRQQQKANKVLADKNEMITQSQKRSDELLLNILPFEVAEELKLTGRCQAKTYSMVTIMFADFKDFTSVSEMVSAELLVDEINYCFSAFDLILPNYGVEKIKTVGDAYICVGGMPTLNFTHTTDVINAAIEIRNFMLQRKKEKEAKGEIPFELRIGIHTGPVVAGIVGVKKYAYDIWGDTVNLSARMESSSEAGRINISGATYSLVKDKFKCTYRGKIQAKNKGEVDMYFVEDITPVNA